MKKAVLSAVVLLFAFSASAEEYFITANRIKQDPSKTSENTEKIEKSELDEEVSIVLDESLRSVNGFYIPSYGRWGASSPRIAGSQSKNILVMKDGIALTDPAGIDRSFNLPNLFLAGTDAVEIVSGPNSAVYGSNAVSGVVNLITAAEGKNNMEISAVGGSHGLFQGAVRAQKTFNRTTMDISGSYMSSRGENISIEGDEEDGVSGYGFSGSLKHRFSDSFSLKASLDTGKNTLEYDAWGAVNAEDAPLEQISTFSIADISADINWLETFSSTIRTAFTANRREYEDDGTVTDVYRGKAFVLALENQLSFSPRFRMFGGLDLRDEKADQDAAWTEMEEHSLTTNELYGGFVYEAPGNISFNSAVRFVSPSEEDWDKVTVFKAGTAYMFGVGDIFGELRGNYGTSYNMPSLYQVYGKSLNYFTGLLDVVGNLELKPETGKGYNFTAEFTLGEEKAGIKLNYSRETFEDYIKMDYVANKYVNASEAEIASWQADAYVKLPVEGVDLKIYASYINSDAEDVTGGMESNLAMVPSYMFKTGLECSFKKISVDLFEETTGDRMASYPAIELEPYTLLNGSLNVKLNKNLSVSLRADNILDEKYEQETTTVDYGYGPVTEISGASGYVVYPGYASPGRSFRIGVRYLFSL